MQKLNEQMYAWLPEMAFMAFSIRLIAMGASVGDSIALLVISLLIAYKRWMSRKKIEEYDLLKQEIALVRDMINGIKLDKAFQLKKDTSNVAQIQKEPGKRFF
jgi:Tfp pilus assembly protein PilN